MNKTQISPRTSHQMKTGFKPVYQAAIIAPMAEESLVKNLIHEIENEELMDPRQASDILDRITDGFFTLSHNWFFTRINPVTKILLQRKKEEIIGKAFYEIFPLRDSEAFITNF